MKIVVDGKDEYGNKSYAKLAQDIFFELGIAGLIEEVHMIIEPSAPLFIMSIRMKRTRSPIKIRDVASIVDTKHGCNLIIRDEGYAANLLSMLWKRYGSLNVEQPSRLEIVCKGVKADELAGLRLRPVEELKTMVLNAMWQILPEGFRVRYSFASGHSLTIIATEDVMREEWIAMGRMAHEKISRGL